MFNLFGPGTEIDKQISEQKKRLDVRTHVYMYR